MRLRIALVLSFGFAAVSCAGKSVPPSMAPLSYSMIPSLPSADTDAKPIGHYIKHLIIIIQENRSLVNLFAGFPGADAPMYGYLSNGKKIQLHSKNFNGPDVPHAFVVALTDWDNGNMDGYDEGIVKFQAHTEHEADISVRVFRP